jgi:hypothetical protein
MNKKLIRLTESDLHRIISESVKRTLMEDAHGDMLASFIEDAKRAVMQVCRKYPNLEPEMMDNRVVIYATNEYGENEGVTVSFDYSI